MTKPTMSALLPVPVEPELKTMIEKAARKTHLSQADVMRTALRLGVPEVVRRLEARTLPKRNLVEYLDKFVGLVKRDEATIKPMKLR